MMVLLFPKKVELYAKGGVRSTPHGSSPDTNILPGKTNCKQSKVIASDGAAGRN
jgi:hypothetical protein